MDEDLPATAATRPADPTGKVAIAQSGHMVFSGDTAPVEIDEAQVQQAMDEAMGESEEEAEAEAHPS